MINRARKDGSRPVDRVHRFWSTLIARTRVKLRSQGRLVPDFDLFVAETGLAYDLTLMTRNHRHCDRIEGPQLFEETQGAATFLQNPPYQSATDPSTCQSDGW